MKILFLTNSDFGKELSDWIKSQNNDDEVIVKGGPITESDIKNYQLDLIISYGYRHIIKNNVLLMGVRAINLHISYLPLNRGADPLIWSILENSIHGVTIHQIDKGVDTGPILYQEVYGDIYQNDTLSEIYLNSQKQIQRLFKKNWHLIKANKYALKSQNCELTPTNHLIIDLKSIKNNLLGERGWNISVGELKARFKKIHGNKYEN